MRRIVVSLEALSACWPGRYSLLLPVFIGAGGRLSRRRRERIRETQAAFDGEIREVLPADHGSSLILLLSGLTLAESLHIEHRHRLSVGSLLIYRRIGVDRQFVLPAMSSALNFGALFLYISSAPRFVLDFLRLSVNEFYWLFVPAVTGIITGSWVAGRISGRFTDPAVLRTGFGIILIACVVNAFISDPG